MDAMTACFKFAGACGYHPRGMSLRDLWPLYCGRQLLIRQQVVWQSMVLFNEKLNAAEFIRTGRCGPIRDRGVDMPDDLAEAVAIAQAKQRAEHEARLDSLRPKLVAVMPGVDTVCDECNGGKFILRGRARMICRRCHGRGRL